MKKAFLALLLLIIGYFYLWLFFGMFRDEITIFRFTNYFGMFVSIFSPLMGLAAAIVLKQKWIRLAVLVVSVFPIFIVPLAPEFGAMSGRWEGDSAYKGAPVFDIVTFSKTSYNNNYGEIKGLVDCSLHDIIVVQEFNDWDDFASSEPEALEGCHIANPGNKWKSLVVISRFPIKEANLDEGLLVATLDVGDHELIVATRRFDRSITAKGARLQSKQISYALDRLKGQGAVILAGDFNSTQYNESLYRIRREFAYADSGLKAFQDTTFPAAQRWYAFLGPIVRIDHIFFRGLVSESVDILDNNYGSDHYPVRAVFTFPEVEGGQVEQ